MMRCDQHSDSGSAVSQPKGPSSRRGKRALGISILAALVVLLHSGYSEAALITKKWGECTTCDYKSVTQDSYIDGQSTKYNQGAATEVRVGRKDTSTDPDRPTRGLIKFNFSNIGISSASQITSAKLYVYIHNREGSNLVDAHRVLKSWNQGNKSGNDAVAGEVSWRHSINPTEWSTWGCDGTGSDREAAVAASKDISVTGWASFDVTASAQAMFASGQYHGWLLKRHTEPNDNTTNRVFFRSSEYTDATLRPYLEIIYSDQNQLRVEPNELSMLNAETKTTVVSGGTPGYTVSSNTPSVATAGVSGNTITVTAVSQGSATITVRDSTGASVSVAVTVTAPLAATPANLSLYPGQTATVAVSGGSPGYTVVSGNPVVAQASISGSSVTITALGSGTITVTVADAGNHYAYVAVTVGESITPGLGDCPAPPFTTSTMGPNVMILFDTSGSMSEDDDGDGKSRFQEAREAVLATLDANPSVRFGLMRMDGTGWREESRPGGLITDRNRLQGGRVLVPCGFKGSKASSAAYIKWYIETYMITVEQMRADYGAIHNTNLAETLADIGRYFATVVDGDGHRVGKGPAGFGYYMEGTDYTHYYDKNGDGTLEPFQAQSTDDVGNTIDTTSPIQRSCEQSFVVIFTDGQANHDNDWSVVTDVIGNYDGENEWRDCKRAAPTVMRPDITDPSDPNYGVPLPDADYPCDTRPDWCRDWGEPDRWGEIGETNWLDDVAKYLYDKDLRSDIPGVQNIITYTIGFYHDDSLLRSAARLGGGKYFTARSLDELTEALQSAMEDIMLKVASGTAVSTITTSSSTDDYLIRAKFFPGDSWKGYLERFTLPYDGDDPDYHADWDAGTLLKNRVAANGHTGRKIYTYMSSQDPRKQEFKYADPVKSRMKTLWGGTDNETRDMINYLRGDTTHDGGKYKDRSGWLLGDIVYSTPIAVGVPKGWYFDRPAIEDPPEYASYQAFKTTHRLRKTMIYVGANDGMLHAFDANTGQEDWAFIPENLHGKLKDLTVGGCHKYYVDLTPYIADAWFGIDGDVDTAHGSDWKTVLIGGNRFGGEEYFALDVTNPAADQFSALWDRIPFAGKMSSTIPVIGKVKADDGDVDTWVAFVTSGYHAGTDPGAIAALRVKSGSKRSIWRKTDGSYTSDCSTQAKGSRIAGRSYYTMSSPAALDSDLDGYLDLVYAGDTEGSLWKFYYDYAADGWKKVELFNTGGQAITATPSLAFDSAGNLRIYFGTGKYLEESDKADSTRNAFYCLVEAKQYPGNANDGHYTGTTAISKLNLANLTSTVTQAQYDALAEATRIKATANGWYFELDVPSSYPAERILERALVVSGVVFLTTFVPNQDVCGFGGNARLYAVNYLHGVVDQVVLTQMIAGKRYADIGLGVPSEPVYYFDPTTKKPRILIQKSDSNVEDPQPILPERPIHVRSWKDG